MIDWGVMAVCTLFAVSVLIRVVNAKLKVGLWVGPVLVGVGMFVSAIMAQETHIDIIAMLAGPGIPFVMIGALLFALGFIVIVAPELEK